MSSEIGFIKILRSVKGSDSLRFKTSKNREEAPSSYKGTK